MEMKLQETKIISPIFLCAGDTLSVTYTSSDGVRTLSKYDATESLMVNRVAIFKIDNDFGFKKALSIVIGEAE